MAKSTSKDQAAIPDTPPPAPARRRLFQFADLARTPALGCNKSMLGCD